MSINLIVSIFGIIFGLVVLMLGVLTPLESIPFTTLGMVIIYLSIKSIYKFNNRS